MNQQQALKIAQEWKDAAEKARKETPPRIEFADALEKYADDLMKMILDGFWRKS